MPHPQVVCKTAVAREDARAGADRRHDPADGLSPCWNKEGRDRSRPSHFYWC